MTSEHGILMTGYLKLPGPEIIKKKIMLNSTEHELLTNTKILTNEEVYCFKPLICCIYHANNCWHFNIYEQDQFRCQLS